MGKKRADTGGIRYGPGARAAASQATAGSEAPPGRGSFPAPLCRPDCAPVFETVDLPLWSEAVWPLEWVTLWLSPIFYGRVGRRGTGGPVVVVPGFMASDLHLLTLHGWLRRVGYRPLFSDIGRNADCPDVLLERLTETIESAHRETRRKVQLIGHSFGGVLARAAAARQPERVSQVITLAAPFRALRAHPLVLNAARRLGGLLPSPSVQPRPHGDHSHTGECSCQFLHETIEPWPAGVLRAAIYTKRDGVVDWRSSMEDDAELNFEVHASHMGLVFNADVYRLLSHLLADGEANAGHEREPSAAARGGR